MYECKIRDWWRYNPHWPNDLEPYVHPWHKSKLLAEGIKTEAEAIAICSEYNRTHRPGKYSRKAEFTET
jgi:hypothetical protein